jgi:hypothetical protein
MGMEEENRRGLEELRKKSDYEGNPFMPGSMAYGSDTYKESVERMLEAGKSFDDR